MALPTPAWDGVELRWAGVRIDGTPAAGKLVITADAPRFLDTTLPDAVAIFGVPIFVPIDSEGRASYVVPATDDPDKTPTNFTYSIREDLVGGGGTTLTVEAPLSRRESGIDLVRAFPVGPSSGAIQSPVTRAEFDALDDSVTSRSRSHFLVAVDGVYPERLIPEETVVFIGPVDPDALGLMEVADTWINKADLPGRQAGLYIKTPEGLQVTATTAGPTGEPGPAGPANQLTVGTTTTGAPGTPAVVEILGQAPNQTINVTVPRGDTGDVTPALEQAKADAQNAAAAAAGSAATADQARDTAAGHASSASTSAGQAAGSATTAGQARDAAVSARDTATAAATTAGQARDTAAGHAGDASTSAGQAAGSATTAAGHAGTANTARLDAQSARDAAQSARDLAAGSATAAAASATAADDAADRAEAAATTATAGGVRSINGQSPDAQGSVTLTATHVGAASPADVSAASSLDRARSNHTGTQTSATISDFAEAVQDAVATLLASGSNVTLTYDDAADRLTVSAAGGDAEVMRDTIGSALVGVGNIAVTVNDAADTITISTTATANSTDAQLRDRSTHTGTQPVSTITNLQGTLDGKVNNSGVSTIYALTKAAYDGIQYKDGGGFYVIQKDASDTPKRVENGATLNATDAALRARASHTGTQAASTISDFKPAVGSALGVFPVSAYGTVDGVDDQVQIQAAVDAATAAKGGGIVWLDAANYVCSAPIVPKSGVTFYGAHTPRYEPSGAVSSATRIQPAAGFVGDGLIAPTAAARGVRFHQVALHGNGVTNSTGQPIHGIRMPAQGDVTGEQGWHLDNVTIASFTGSGVYGSAWVWSILNLFVHNNARYGIETNGATADRWTDVKATNVWAFFNRLGGVAFAGGISGGVQWFNCRFERSGQVHGNPENNPVSADWNAAAPGFLLRKGQFITFTNCTTDANNGNGWDLYGSPADINNVSFTSCVAKRDGGGDQATLPDRAGFLVGGDNAYAGTQNVTFVNCLTIPGKSKDTSPSAAAVTSPANGLLLINALQTRWSGPPPAGSLASYTRYGDNYGCGLLLMQDDGALQYVKDNADPITLGEVNFGELDGRYLNAGEEISDVNLPARLDSGAAPFTDFNAATAVGFWRTNNAGAIANKPPTGGDYWMLLVQSYNGAGDLVQIATNWGGTPVTYRRDRQGGTWGAWVEQRTDAQLLDRANHTGSQPASSIGSGIIDRGRLGTNAVGTGLRYLADDSTWKPISAGGPTVDTTKAAGTWTNGKSYADGAVVYHKGVYYTRSGAVSGMQYQNPVRSSGRADKVGGSTSTMSFVVPADTRVGDVIVLTAMTTSSGGQYTPTVSASSGNTFTGIGSSVVSNGTNSGGTTIYSLTSLQYRIATATDPGSTVTVAQANSLVTTQWFVLRASTGFTGASDQYTSHTSTADINPTTRSGFTPGAAFASDDWVLHMTSYYAGGQNALPTGMTTPASSVASGSYLEGRHVFGWGYEPRGTGQLPQRTFTVAPTQTTLDGLFATHTLLLQVADLSPLDDPLWQAIPQHAARTMLGRITNDAWRGAYSPTATYNAGDVVADAATGRSYMAIQNAPANTHGVANTLTNVYAYTSDPADSSSSTPPRAVWPANTIKAGDLLTCYVAGTNGITATSLQTSNPDWTLFNGTEYVAANGEAALFYRTATVADEAGGDVAMGGAYSYGVASFRAFRNATLHPTEVHNTTFSAQNETTRDGVKGVYLVTPASGAVTFGTAAKRMDLVNIHTYSTASWVVGNVMSAWSANITGFATTSDAGVRSGIASYVIEHSTNTLQTGVIKFNNITTSPTGAVMVNSVYENFTNTLNPAYWIEVSHLAYLAKPGPFAQVERTGTAAASYSTISTTMVDVDPANLALTFVAPATGAVRVTLQGTFNNGNAAQNTFWALRDGNGTLVVGTTRYAPSNTAWFGPAQVWIKLTGLTPGETYTYRWAWRVLSTSYTAYLYYAPTDQDGNAWGPLTMEAWPA